MAVACSSAFVSVSQQAGATFRAAFLARHGEIDPATHLYDSPVDGIYLAETLGPQEPKVKNLVQTGIEGTFLDRQALDAETNEPLAITFVGLERDSLRGRWVVINAAMGSEETGWAGFKP
ncbi:MAG: hypothetical protein SCH71_17355 [Desulfobulbaceae bacterium]|nr:hypothetical protein [Desulfobulbaceae bacterium]